MKTTRLIQTALFTILCLASTSKVLAHAVTFTFTGHVTDANFSVNQGGNILYESHDPNSNVSWNGVNVFNGNSVFSGTMIFDSDTPYLQPPSTYYSQSDYNNDPSTGYRGVIYQLSTEGISFTKSPGIWAFMSFYNNAEKVSVNAEDDVLTNTGAINFIYQTLIFNFNSGKFTGGTFNLAGNGYGPLYQEGISTRGVLTGQIDTLTISQVPIPPTSSLLGSGLIGLIGATYRQKQK